MANKVGRGKLLTALEAVRPGLSPREIVEQSNCFVFRDGRVWTFNDEVAASAPSPLNGVEGAVQADPLLTILGKLTEDELDVSTRNGELVFAAPRRRCGLRLDAEVALPVDAVERPKKGDWKDLPEEFTEAVSKVVQCAGTDESQFALTCVHLHPKWLEACDNFQLCRWRLKTGVESPTLLRRTSLTHLKEMGKGPGEDDAVRGAVRRMAESQSWVHFRTGTGVVLSCRRFDVEEFPDMGTLLKLQGGVTASLPKELIQAADRAAVFSAENPENNLVLVDLGPDGKGKGKIRLRGQGVSGWYTETKTIRYQGPPIRFTIAPDLLQTIVGDYSECEIGKDRLRVGGGAWTYISCLHEPPKDGDRNVEEGLTVVGAAAEGEE